MYRIRNPLHFGWVEASCVPKTMIKIAESRILNAFVAFVSFADAGQGKLQQLLRRSIGFAEQRAHDFHAQQVTRMVRMHAVGDPQVFPWLTIRIEHRIP